MSDSNYNGSYKEENRDLVTIPLLKAAMENNIDKLKELIRIGADIEDKDSNGMTALMYAADSNSIDAEKLLLDAGAYIEAKDNEGMTAMMHAVNGGL